LKEISGIDAEFKLKQGRLVYDDLYQVHKGKNPAPKHPLVNAVGNLSTFPPLAINLN